MKLWKKVLAAVTAGVLCVGSVGVTDLQGVLESAGTMLTASAEEGTYGNLSYGVTNAGEIEITGCNMGVTSVEIPAEIDRKPVTSIGNNAFRDCTSLTEVKIPDSVINIGDYAFYGCTNLTIYGYTGSYAETYAKENDIPFVSLGNITTTETTTTTIETTVTTTTETMVTTKTTTTTTKQDSETPTVIYGDITLDGRVDITDAVLLNKFCSGAVILNDAAKLNSDCDGDGDITGNDAVALLQFLVQIVQKLPYTA